MKKMRQIIIVVLIILSGAKAHLYGQNVPNDIFYPTPITTSNLSMPSFNLADLNASMFNFNRTYVPRTKLSSINTTNLSMINTLTTYNNGWNEPILTINRTAAVAIKDIITPYYRKNSLTQYSFPPYPYTNGSKFQALPFTSQKSYYSGSGNVTTNNEGGFSYGKTSISVSNNRFNQYEYQPGMSFVGNGNGILTYTLINDITIDDIWIWGRPVSRIPYALAKYPSGTLTIKVTESPDGGITKEFYNKNNQLVCKRVKASATQWLTTYYLYDDLGRIEWILPPKSSNFIIQSSSINPNSYPYHYIYNQYGQVVERRIPDRTGNDQYVYDLKRRQVLYQSPLLASQSKWQFTVYDSKDRVVMTGLTSSTRSRQDWEAVIINGTYTSGSIEEYLIEGFRGVYPSTPAFDVHVYNYYDYYSQMPTDMALRDFQNLSAYYLPSNSEIITPVMDMPKSIPRSRLLGSRVRVLDPNNNNSWVQSVFFYDYSGKLIQTQTLHPWQTDITKWDIVAKQYDFSGNTVLDIVLHNAWSAADKAATTLLTKYTYLYTTGKLTTVQQNVDNQGWLPIATYLYDELGRVNQKILGSVEDQKYSYNIRGQLMGINKDYVYNWVPAYRTTFGEMICYDYAFDQRRYDGSIAGYIWRGNGSLALPRAYGYSYDLAGRMTAADFNERADFSSLQTPNVPKWKHTDVDYSVSNISYDINGNMLTMDQRGMATVVSGGTSSVQPVDIDKLEYHYISLTNQLDHVDDDPSTYHVNDFNDLHLGNGDYSYDDNGNLKMDLNKGLSLITYNHMNLPVTIQGSAGNAVNIYDGNGNLLEKRVTVGGNTTTTRFWGPFVYQNDNMQYFLHQEGRSRWLADSNFFKNDFFVKDHIDNVRTVLACDVSYGIREYHASFEFAYANTEETIFDNIGGVRTTKPIGSPQDLMSARLNGAEVDHRIGAAILIHAMAGDQLNLSAYGYYEEPDSNDLQQYTDPEAMFSSLLNTMTGASSLNMGENGPSSFSSQTISSIISPANYSAYETLKQDATDPSYPRAYLNYLVFDEQMNLVPEQSQVVQLRGNPNDWNIMELPAASVMGVNGYIFAYLSNESSFNVFADNEHLTNYYGRVLEEDHYYPHGLHIEAGGQLTTPLPNKYLHQTKKLQDELGLDLYDFHARQYDAQLGRFWSLDPADQFPSGYTGMANNPANFVDPTGMIANARGIEDEGTNVSNPELQPRDNASYDDYDYVSADQEEPTVVYNEEGKKVADIQDGKNYALVLYGNYNGPYISYQGNVTIQDMNKVGIVYDIDNFFSWFDSNYDLYNVNKVQGINLNELRNIVYKDKPLKIMRAEAISNLIDDNGVVRAGKNKSETDNDLLNSDPLKLKYEANKINGVSIHLHQFVEGEGRLTYGRPSEGSVTDGPIGGVSGNDYFFNQYYNRPYRNVAVDRLNVYLISKYGYIKISR